MALQARVAALAARGVDANAAEEAALLCGDAARSVDALAAALESTARGACAWRELHSARYAGRPYYHNTDSGATAWEEPPAHALWAGRLDCDTFGLAAAQVGAIVSGLRALQAQARSDADTAADATSAAGGWPAARDTLATLLRNAVDSPGEARYRTLRTGNAALRQRLLRHGAAAPLLRAVGFVPTVVEGAAGEGESLHLPLAAPLAAARCLLARLTAAQALTDDTASGSGGGSGSMSAEEAALRRYQKEVHACAACAALINDGSERAWTGRWDAPAGEYRYICVVCCVSLCQACHDRHVSSGAASSVHPPGHGLTPVPPVSSRLAAAGGSGAAMAQNPWGNFSASVSARSRQRLKDRTGM